MIDQNQKCENVEYKFYTEDLFDEFSIDMYESSLYPIIQEFFSNSYQIHQAFHSILKNLVLSKLDEIVKLTNIESEKSPIRVSKVNGNEVNDGYYIFD